MHAHSRFFLYLSLCCFFVMNILYAFWSYTQTDPNLVITQWAPYWNTQLWLWQLPDLLVTQIYVLLIAFMFACYALIIFSARTARISLRTALLVAVLVASPLVFSNNALSHDVFNYMFNAKMVLKYGANPHVKVALDFPYDDWLRFMHNVHTPAPYFYGWTAMSLLPYALGAGKFVITWTLFRLWSMLGWGVSLVFAALLIKKSDQKHRWWWIIVAFNPLLMVELISNAHNDGWMMWPALASFWLLMPLKNKIPVWKMILSLLLLFISASTKYITLALLPVWGILFLFPSGLSFLQSKASSLRKRGSDFSIISPFNLFDLIALILFLPLLTARSQYFHPWYLSWSLVWLPVMKNKWFKILLISLSVSSLLRYVPWLVNGGFEYTDVIISQERYISCGVGLLVSLVGWGILLYKKRIYIRS